MANDDFALVPLFCALPEAKKSFASQPLSVLCDIPEKRSKSPSGAHKKEEAAARHGAIEREENGGQKIGRVFL